MTSKTDNARETKMSPKEFPRGTKVRINDRHWGCRGSTGKVSRKAPETIQGRLYWTVRLTGGRGRNSHPIRFLASEMDRN